MRESREEREDAVKRGFMAWYFVRDGVSSLGIRRTMIYAIEISIIYLFKAGFCLDRERNVSI